MENVDPERLEKLAEAFVNDMGAALTCALARHPYDVVAYFNCLHDVGVPRRSLTHARSTMKADGLLLMTEPMAGHRVEENFNAVGRIMSGSSVLCCTPHGIADGGEGLGTLVTDEKLRAVALEAGFSQFERVHETRYSRVFLGRP